MSDPRVEDIEGVGGVTNQPVEAVGGKYIAVCETDVGCSWSWAAPIREHVRVALLRHSDEAHRLKPPAPEPPTRKQRAEQWLSDIPPGFAAVVHLVPEVHAWVHRGAQLIAAADKDLDRNAKAMKIVHTMAVDVQSPVLNREAFDRAVKRLREQGPGRIQ